MAWLPLLAAFPPVSWVAFCHIRAAGLLKR